MPRTPQTEHDKLKHEISKRWPLIGHDMIARAQLEYILQEAGLLAKPRKRTPKQQPTEGILNLGTPQ